MPWKFQIGKIGQITLYDHNPIKILINYKIEKNKNLRAGNFSVLKSKGGMMGQGKQSKMNWLLEKAKKSL